MNTLATVGAALAALWFTIWGFNTISQPAIGYAALGIFFLFIGPLLVWAVLEDLEQVRRLRERFKE